MPDLMRMQDYLEQDRGRVLEELKQAQTPERAVAVLESETDRLLFQFNEQSVSERGRDAAASMLQTARTVLPAIDVVGETKIWEMARKAESEEVSKKKTALMGILLLLGGLVLGFVDIALVYGAQDFPRWLAAVLFLGSAAAVFASARQFVKPPKADNVTRRAENLVDAEKLYRIYHACIVMIDRNIESALSAERWAEKNDPAALALTGTMTAEEAELFSDLLEASYSGDGDFALSRLNSIRYYLHKRGVEAVDYGEETKAYFDLMPSGTAGTFRPALISDGRVLCRGVACAEDR